MKSILKQKSACTRRCAKTVSFPAGGSLCTNVHEADEWDRSPVAATRKLTYQDILELKEMQIALMKNSPAFPHLLSSVPVGLLPLLSTEHVAKSIPVIASGRVSQDEFSAKHEGPNNPLSPDTERPPSPPVALAIPTQATRPKRRIFLPILPLQEPSSPPQNDLTSLCPPPTNPSPTQHNYASTSSQSNSSLSPVPQHHSTSQLSYSGISLYIPSLNFRPTSRSPTPETITVNSASQASSSPGRTALDSPYLQRASPARRDGRLPLPVEKYTPLFGALPGLRTTLRDVILPPNPIFAPYYGSALRFGRLRDAGPDNRTSYR